MRGSLFLAAALTIGALMSGQTPAKNFFKVSGSPSARVQFEIYTDFSCPHCREFYLDVLPSVTREFVATGKVRLVHRDFVLGSFPFSKTAAHYANAAGQIGKYELVAGQLFQTQTEWSQNGNVDGAVAKVLSPADMSKVRNIVKNDITLDDTVKTDMAMGTQDRLSETPTLVIVANGKREVISGGVPYPILKSYLDQKLSK